MQAGGGGVGERRAAAMGDDVQPLRGPGRPVIQVHPPAPEVALAALSLNEIVVLAHVAQVVAVADVAADPLTGRAAARSTAVSSSGSVDVVQSEKPVSVPRACRSTRQRRWKWNPSSMVEASTSGANTIRRILGVPLITGAQRPGGQELSRWVALQQRLQGRPVADRSRPPWPSSNSAAVTSPPSGATAIVGWVAGSSTTARCAHVTSSVEEARWHTLPLW